MKSAFRARLPILYLVEQSKGLSATVPTVPRDLSLGARRLYAGSPQGDLIKRIFGLASLRKIKRSLRVMQRRFDLEDSGCVVRAVCPAGCRLQKVGFVFADLLHVIVGYAAFGIPLLF